MALRFESLALFLVPINAKKLKWPNWNGWTQLAYETIALVLQGGGSAHIGLSLTKKPCPSC
jgi:hypothetical protein